MFAALDAALALRYLRDRMNGFQSVAPILGGAVALGCVLGALAAGRRRRLIDNLPTSKTTGVFIGLAELKGTAESPRPFTSFLAARPCVLYSWTVEEHWSRTVTETYTDGDGKTKTRTKTESGWTTVDSGGESAPFYLRDDHGSILVRPEGAKLEPLTIFSETCGRLDPLYYGKGPATSIMDSDHRRKFTEQAVPLHAPLYVMGQARERQDIVAAEIAADKTAPLFLISTRTESQVSSGFGWAFWGWGVFGFIAAVAGVVGHFSGTVASNEKLALVAALAALGYFALCGLGWVWMVFNSMIDLRQRVRQAWSQVDVQLKRRHDLIPNLVAAVNGLRDHERNLQTELAGLRSQMAATPPGVSGPDYHACTPTLRAIVEKYPELTAQPLFADLQKNLADTENRIALARGYFNEIASFYNGRLERVPDRFVCRLGNLQPQPLMVANDFERAPIQVDFAT